MQIIDDPGFASSMGTGIAGGLQNLLNMKMQDMARQKKSTALESLGLPAGLSEVDPKVLQQFMKNQQTQKQMASAANILSDGQEAQPAGQQQVVQPGVETTQTDTSQPAPTQPSKASRIKKADRLEKAALVAPADVRKDYLQMAKNIRQEITDEEKSARAEKEKAFESTKEFRKKMYELESSARGKKDDLERLERLVLENKLISPGSYEFLKRSGLDTPSIMGSGAEEFQKITQTFMKDVKNYVGSQVSQLELQEFMKTIPSLSQSAKGKLLVMANMNKFYDLSEAEGKISRDLIKKTGKPPLDLMEQITERMGKKRRKIDRNYRRAIQQAERLPESTIGEKAADVYQAAAGSIVGAPGKLATRIGGLLPG